MSKRAIFAHVGQALMIDVAAKLHNQYGWEICYFIGTEALKEKTLKLFPNAVFQTFAEARKALVPDGCEMVTQSPLDKQLLFALSFHETIFLKMMDRYDFDGSFTYLKRITTYHSQIMYWKGVLEHFKPDVVVFLIAPHAGYDYALYSLCRVMDIPTFMFERTSLPGFLYPVSSFEEGSEIIRDAYAEAIEKDNNNKVTLTPESEIHLANLSKSYDKAMPFHEKFKSIHNKKEGDLGSTASIFWGLARDLVKTLLKRRDEPNYFSKKFHKRIGKYKRKKLLDCYQQLANEVDLAVPYIFVALQCEPERQTCPVGGKFGNQYVMVDLLSKLVPDGWKVYVKEHRSQFKTYQAAERAKSIEYYKMITSMQNVELVPLTYTSFELIDRAKASATVSGTVGWESVVRGRPALLFGHSWFQDCKGVFVTHNVEDCQDAIQQIQNGFQVNIKDVKSFVQIVERYSTKGYIDPIYEKMNIISPKSNVENLAKAIHEFVILDRR